MLVVTVTEGLVRGLGSQLRHGPVSAVVLRQRVAEISEGRLPRPRAVDVGVVPLVAKQLVAMVVVVVGLGCLKIPLVVVLRLYVLQTDVPHHEGVHRLLPLSPRCHVPLLLVARQTASRRQGPRRRPLPDASHFHVAPPAVDLVNFVLVFGYFPHFLGYSLVAMVIQLRGDVGGPVAEVTLAEGPSDL